MTRISRDWVAGGILLIVGAFLLALEFLPDLAFLMPLLIGLALLGIFLLVRSPALLSAGGVITGVGVGILTAAQGSPDFGGAGVLASVGGGFLLVSLFGAMFGITAVRSWPLIPGLALIALGTVIYAAGLGEEMLDISARGWPVLLVVVGAYLLLAARLRLPLYGERAVRADAVSDETDATVAVVMRDRDERRPEAPTN
ncbi:MAG: hypothetical protein M3452_07515 [Chloroflexota bacterium]|nr:hypothetical protein [Chloroflexota bacterium]